MKAKGQKFENSDILFIDLCFSLGKSNIEEFKFSGLAVFCNSALTSETLYFRETSIHIITPDKVGFRL